MLATYFARLIAIYRAEPVRVNVHLVNLIVLVAAYFDVVIEPDAAWQVLGALGLITGIGELTRRGVTPYAPEAPIELDANPDDD